MAKVDNTDMDTLKKAEEIKTIPHKMENDYLKTAIDAHNTHNDRLALATKV
jgi:hypothetical protein